MALAAARRMKLLRVAKLLGAGGAIAHETSTLPGIAALPASAGLLRIRRFKGRRGPFLLLAASRRDACRLIRSYSPELRRQLHAAWPGETTLVVPARPLLPAGVAKRGAVAIRVDGDAGNRYLAAKCGGLLLSSSLNRRGGSWRYPDRRIRFRWHRYLDGAIAGAPGSGRPSTLLRVRGRRLERLR